MTVNRNAHLVIWSPDGGGHRTYACADMEGLRALVEHLTGRAMDTFMLDEKGFPQMKGLTIANPLHIYSGKDTLPEIRECLMQAKMATRGEDEWETWVDDALSLIDEAMSEVET